MANGNFLTNIKSSYGKFTKAEKKVAEYILMNPKQVVFMSISDLAEACDVGDTSVFRFCRTMKLQGYQEFKMQLSLSINVDDDIEIQKETVPISMEDSFDMLSRKLLQNYMSAIKGTFSILNQGNIERAVQYLENAERVYFFGTGTSMVSAMAATNRFLKITPKVQCSIDPNMQAMQASMLRESDLAIIISCSGTARDMVHVAKMAKGAGAKIISITRQEKSPLAEASNVTILCSTNQAPLESDSIGGQISQFYILELFYHEYYKRQYEVSSVNHKKTAAAIADRMF